MDAFLKSATWRYDAFLRSASGDIWRIWFGNDGQPLMQKLTDDQRQEYREAIDQLRNPHDSVPPMSLPE